MLFLSCFLYSLGQAGARRLGLPAPTTSAHTTPPLYLPTRLPHISAGEQEFEGWEAGEVGGIKRVKGRLGYSRGGAGPGVPTGHRLGFHAPKVCLFRGSPRREPGPEL